MPSSIKKKAIPVDLGKITDIATYRRLVENELKDLDIGILCLNAGTVESSPFELLTDELVEGQIVLNGLQIPFFTKAIMKKLIAQRHTSAVLLTSSGCAELNLPGLSCYCATKRMSTFLMRSLHDEFKESGKIDVLAWQAGLIQSGLN